MSQTIHSRRAKMANEIARLKEEADMMRINNSR